jgi:outer membrane protein OmpA-like peptidoglycan-associated protein
MKRIAIWLTAAMLASSAVAQTVQESKPSDNIYLGINGGMAVKTTGVRWMHNLNPNIGVRIGRWFTPVFGLAVDGSAYFSNKPFVSTGTLVRATNVSLLGTVNFTNLFGGYPGEPRFFEVAGFYGVGWGHLFRADHQMYEPTNKMTSKAGIDFNFNFGSDLEWQFFIEPSFTWALLGSNTQPALQPAHKLSFSDQGPRYNVNNSAFQIIVGLAYKFANSNGSHNFRLAGASDDRELKRLNGIINDLRAQLAQQPREVVREVPGQVVRAENLVLVTFAQGKSLLTQDAMDALNVVRPGAHVQIIGTASPEGGADLNLRLSQARADAVAAYLRDRGVIVDEAIGHGVQGNTSNRLAIVYVK